MGVFLCCIFNEMSVGDGVPFSIFQCVSVGSYQCVWQFFGGMSIQQLLAETFSPNLFSTVHILQSYT